MWTTAQISYGEYSLSDFGHHTLTSPEELLVFDRWGLQLHPRRRGDEVKEAYSQEVHRQKVSSSLLFQQMKQQRLSSREKVFGNIDLVRVIATFV